MDEIPVEIEIFDDPLIEAERVRRTDTLRFRLAELPSHSRWWISEVHDDWVRDYIACAIHVRELDRLIMNDPLTYGGLDRQRNTISARLSKLKTDLGLTATRMAATLPKVIEESGMEALAEVVDEDYTE